MSRRGRIALAVVALLACAGALRVLGVLAPVRDADRVAPHGATLGEPAIAALDGVALGTSPWALRRARTVEPAPYVGLAEAVDGARVHYRFGGVEPSLASMWRAEDGGVPPWQRLASVEAHRERPSTAAADSLWRAGAERLAASAPGEVRCFAYEHGVTPAVAALREADGRVAGVVRYPRREERDAHGPVVIPATVVAFVARDAALVVPASAVRTPIDCARAP